MKSDKKTHVCECNKQTELMVGICFFIAGIMLWLSSIGIIDTKVVWANILMIVGIIFTAKEVYFSFR